MTSVRTRLFKGSSIIFVFTLITAPLGYVIRMLFSRALLPDEYGLMYALLSFFALLTMLNDLGFGNAVVYYIPRLIQHRKFADAWRLYQYDQMIEIGTSFLIAATLHFSQNFWVSSFFKHEMARPLLFIFSVYLIGNGLLSSVQKYLIGLQKEMQYSAIELFRLSYTTIFTLVLFLSSTHSITSYGWAFASGYVVVGICYWIYIQRYRPHNSAFFLDFTLLKRGMLYALPTLFSTTMYIIIHYTDMLFLTAFQSVSVVGVYNIIFPIVSMAALLLEPASKMITPLISELHGQKKDSELRILIEQILRLIPTLSVLFSLFLVLFPKGIISMLFGFKWVASAAPLLQLVAIAYLPMILMMYLFSVCNGLGMVKERLKLLTTSAIASTLGGYMGARFFGIEGIILTNALVYLVTTIALLWIIRNAVQFHLPWKQYLIVLVFSCVAYFFRSKLEFVPVTIIEMVSTVTLYSLAGTGLLLVSGAIDRSFIRSFLRAK